MRICSEIAGFSLREADDVRRAMGRKKVKVLKGYEEQFVKGFQESGLDKSYAEEQWDSLLGFADYCLAYDTEVLCRIGSYRYPVKIGWLVENEAGFDVFSIDEKGNRYEQEIVQWHDRGMKEVFEYTLEDGSTISCTPDHQFMTTNGEMHPIEEIFELGLEMLKT